MNAERQGSRGQVKRGQVFQWNRVALSLEARHRNLEDELDELENELVKSGNVDDYDDVMKLVEEIVEVVQIIPQKHF